jgi:hypothetical protein
MLWGPDWFINGLGMRDFIEAQRTWLGVAFLTCIVIGLSPLVTVTWRLAQQRWTRWERERQWHQRARSLTEPEKQILRGYIEGGTRTQSLDWGDGVVNGLITAQVLHQSSRNVYPTGWGGASSQYNIHPWAWDYLRKHPELLAEGEASLAATT